MLGMARGSLSLHEDTHGIKDSVRKPIIRDPNICAHSQLRSLCRNAFREGGISEDDPVYTTKHEAVLKRLIPSSRLPQGQGTTNYSPMMSQVLPADWKEHQKAVAAV